jgi:transposase
MPRMRSVYSVNMLVFEAKLEGTKQQYERLTQAIRTARFVRNSCIRYWMDNKGIGQVRAERLLRCSCQRIPLGW